MSLLGMHLKVQGSKDVFLQKNLFVANLLNYRRRRRDYLHKESTRLADKYDAILIEDLNVKAIANKGFGNGKATLDNGWGMFTKMLDYKMAERGKCLQKVDKWYPSSQTCSVCGCVNEDLKNLSIRKWTCPHCGAEHERDINAVINIKQEGLRLLNEAG